MKTTDFFPIQILMTLCLVFAIGCSEDESIVNGSIPSVNKLPSCRITNPQNNAQFNVDDNILVTVVAEDTDGSIAEVQLYVDNAGHTAKATFPYNFIIYAGELSAGSYTLKAVAKDNEGGKGESSVGITIIKPSTESPDFVGFSDGKIPNTWHTTAWVVDNAIGHDDKYSLRATASNVAVTTSKTCNSNLNFVEFYVRSGAVNFFVDGKKLKECVAENNWAKFGFYLNEGLHTLKWESVSSSVNIDAIRFSKVNFAVGMNYQGGIIAYLDNSGEHGLIAAPNDQSAGIQWYNGSNILTGANGSAIGTGKSNTEKIVQVQDNGSYAAKICDDLVLNGYNDWFLPSRDELNELYKNKAFIDNFDISSFYWSSSEDDSSSAWYQHFGYGYQYYYSKNNTHRVRAVRAF